MMGSPHDLILLHAPSVYDFRDLTILRGPVSDLVPSSSVFEMYPVGFVTLAAHLEAYGYRVRIINLAARMLADPGFDVERFIAGLPEPILFGIDLHWLPHTHGALAIAEIVKSCHPAVPILFGGFSSTYFHQELVEYPQVDMVMRGDSTEDALRILLDTIKQGGALEQVPNLTWRDKRGTRRINALQYSPPDLNYIDLDYRQMMIAATRDRDLSGYLPFTDWLRYPIMPLVICRGCVMNCVTCGGSATSFRQMHHRSRPAYRSPEKAAEDLKKIASVSNGPVFTLGDIRQAGPDYVQRFLNAAVGMKVPVILELFQPASESFLRRVANTFPDFAIELSIESHDPVIRKAFGKPYSNQAVEQTIATALDLGSSRFDLFFMIGLPEQTYQSVIDTGDFVETLLTRYGRDRRVHPFISPLAPFLDPGSLAFENPDLYGYTLFYRTLEEHRRALIEPSWEFTLNYRTRWMSRHEIVMATYDIGLMFSEIKSAYGLARPDVTDHVQQALRDGRLLAEEIARLRGSSTGKQLADLHARIAKLNSRRVLEQEDELQIRLQGNRFKFLRLFIFLTQAWFIDKWKKVRTLRYKTQHDRLLRFRPR